MQRCTFPTLHKKMKFSIKDFFSKCDHIRGNLGFCHIYWKIPFWKNFSFFVQCKFLGFCWHQHLFLVSSEKFVKIDVLISILQLTAKHEGRLTYHSSPRHNKISQPKTETKESYIFLSSTSNQFEVGNLKSSIIFLADLLKRDSNSGVLLWILRNY